MPPAVSRFGPQMLSGPFAHAQQPHVPYHNQQDQAPGSAGLPPPSFNHGFNPNPSSNVNPFAHSTNGNGLAGGFGAGGAGGAGTGLASQAAVMGFAHGAALQQQQQARDAVRRSSGGTNGSKGQMKGRIREVWRGNLAQEMHMLRDLIDDYTYISMVCCPVKTPGCECLLTHVLGHRVSWDCCTANGRIHIKGRLSLSDSSLQC